MLMIEGQLKTLLGLETSSIIKPLAYQASSTACEINFNRDPAIAHVH
jgi:hypothetical protein